MPQGAVPSFVPTRPPRPMRVPALRRWVARFVVAFALVGASPSNAQEAFVERTFAEERAADYAAAVEAYFDVLGADPDGLFGHQLALVLPDSLRGGAGPDLVRWWRSQDPVPATALHEGVVEHRLRIAQAEAAFGDDSPAGFDVRGEVYVRFGNPTRRRRIDFETDVFMARAIREEPSVRRTDFPLNEVWHYPDLGPDVYFLFLRTPRGWREGTTMDLLPRALRGGGLAPEMRSRAQLLGTTMRWIYKDLYVFSSDIRTRLGELDMVVGGDGDTFFSMYSKGNGGLQIANEVQRAQNEDIIAQQQRDEALPDDLSRVLEGRDGGTVWRAVRFLDDDGAVTVLVPWRQPAETLVRLAAPIEDVRPYTALLDITVVRYDEEYAREGADSGRIVAPLDGEPVGPRVLTLRSEDASGSFAVEWDQWPADERGEPLTSTPVRATVARVGDLGGLLRTGAVVGVSDILLLDADAVTDAGGLLDRADGLPTPLAVSAVRPGQHLALYFEAYRAGSDPVPVDVEVYVGQRTAGGLFRRSRETSSGVVRDRVLNARRSPQTIDVGEVPVDADEVRFEVTVTVTETGEQVVRSITLPVAE